MSEENYVCVSVCGGLWREYFGVGVVVFVEFGRENIKMGVSIRGARSERGVERGGVFDNKN